MGLRLLCYVIYALTWILRLTYRFRYVGIENLKRAKMHHTSGSYCLASWHEHALAGVLGQVGVKYCFLISRSKDGEFVDFICRRLGYLTVRGSSSKGGTVARQELVHMMEQGVATAFTVDGPRGPRKQCKPGILKTAVEAGGVILPVAAIADRAWVMVKSWDKTKIPKPFAKIIYQFGPPIEIPSEFTEANFIVTLDTINMRLNEAEVEAEGNLNQWKKHPKQLPLSVMG